MKPTPGALVRIGLLALVLAIWVWVLKQPFSHALNLILIVFPVLLVLPVAWLGRASLDAQPTLSRAVWITTFVHYAVVTLFGVAVIRAVVTHQDWPGWTLPVPPAIGLLLVILTGAAALSTVVVLAVKGSGAPFAIALSQRLAAGWLYAWTRNPMVLASLALLVACGIWFQSALFVLWALLLVTPALLFFVKVYEERELEIRFGAPYLEYKARTPMLFPKRPRS